VRLVVLLAFHYLTPNWFAEALWMTPAWLITKVKQRVKLEDTGFLALILRGHTLNSTEGPY